VGTDLTLYNAQLQMFIAACVALLPNILFISLVNGYSLCTL
jgi:hypothetical protein